MFGLESGDKKKKPSAQDFVFELEKELKVESNCREIKKKIESRVQEIKKMLREGSETEGYPKYEAILHGYASLLKVMARFSQK